MSEEIVYLAPEKITPSKLFARAFKRIFMVIISPFSTYEEISTSPEIIGPLVLVFINVLLTVIDRFFLHNYVTYFRVELGETIRPYVFVKDSVIYVLFNRNVTVPSLENLKDGISLFYQYFAWIIGFYALDFFARLMLTYFIAFIIISLLKGSIHGLFSGVGYSLSVYMVQSIVVMLLKHCFPKELTKIVVTLPLKPNFLNDEVIVTRAINIWIASQKSLALTISAFNWFILLWQLVVLTALFIGIGRLSTIKAIISAIVTSLLVAFIRTMIPIL